MNENGKIANGIWQVIVFSVVSAACALSSGTSMAEEAGNGSENQSSVDSIFRRKADEALKKGNSIVFLWSLQKWASIEPELAVKYIDELPSEQIRRISYEVVASEWGVKAPEAAMKWAEHFPAGEFRDSVVLAVVDGWASRDMRAVKEWIRKSYFAGDRKSEILEALEEKYKG